MSTQEILILIITMSVLRFILPALLMLSLAGLVHRLETHYRTT